LEENGEMVMTKSWRADRFGNPAEVLRLVELDLPDPPEKCVAVRVAATGIGGPDFLMLKGGYPMVKAPPVSPGQEVVGTVTAAGPGSKFKPGDRVMGQTLYYDGWGGYAEYCLLPDFRTYLAPDWLSDEQAAGFIIPYKTAYAALVTRTELKPGETLLVLGAAGSSGVAAIQLGKHLGARIIAVASARDKLDFCKSIGADEVINYREANVVDQVAALTNGKGVDIVFDPVGGAFAEEMMQTLAPQGRFALIGYSSGRWPNIDSRQIVLKDCSVVGVQASGRPRAELEKSMLAMLEMARQGSITLPIGRIFEFDEVPTVIQLLEAGPPPGKLILRGTS
jgi:NADPH2:quinone reductase